MTRRDAILSVIMDQPGISRAGIAKALGYKSNRHQTFDPALLSLEEGGWICSREENRVLRYYARKATE